MFKAQAKSYGQTGTKILLEAMSNDKVHLAKFVLDALDGEIVDSKTEGAHTPLISSILLPDGQTRCKFVELLLQRGANVNCQDGDGRTALSYACEKGYLDAVKILVRNNADPEIVDSWGNTALMYAAVAGHSPVVEFLLITEQASFTLPRSAEIEGKCGSTESEIHITWKNNAYILRIYFSKESRDKDIEVWKVSKVQFVYDTSETSQFINAYNPGKHTASTHRLSALVTPAGRSFVCTAQQTLTLISSDHQKGITVSMYDIQIQPFDIASDFMFSEPYKCITDQRERLEETLPLILGFILALIIVITLTVYHFHLKLTANQPQLPRDRSMYKNM
ncbi:lysosome-associated membrane glycoprotein 5 isoform X2 [Micropterus dolomieu]|uniref:lysosome-associated membrane glycoprotein 5 isoform X2 n=1 Tax=Micropterus dolomieu TaxID=147949 RepID=UPI001E8CADD6|nr:lysosome-associated membrane glycoprotein 5 isoform X2 [Micropterus dolomieu]